MTGEDGVGQVVEALVTAPALAALTMGLAVIPAVLDDRIRGAWRTDPTVGPAHLPDRLVALGVVEAVLDVPHRSTPRVSDSGVGQAGGRPDGSGRLERHGAPSGPPPRNPS